MNGYGRDRYYLILEFKGVLIDFGKIELGAVHKVEYFVLELGEII